MATTPPTPQSPSIAARAFHAWNQIVRWCAHQPWAHPFPWISISLVCVLTVLVVIAPLVFLGDWLWSWQITRLWAQIAGTCVALLLAGWVLHGANLNRMTRTTLLIGTLVLMLTLVDSLDGQQDVFTDIVFISALWSCLLAVETDRIARHIPVGARRMIGMTVGSLATCLFAGSAIAYTGYNLGGVPLRYDHHILYALGIVISAGLQQIQPPKSGAR